jgi:hypothetical protein
MKNITPPQRRLNVMIAALGTLPFLATLWLLVVLGARVLEESGAKIAAALKGKPEPERRVAPGRLRIRWSGGATPSLRRLRAAA